MFTAQAMQNLAASLQAIASKAYATAFSIKERIVKIQDDKTRTPQWKLEMLGPLKASPEIDALLYQGKLGRKAFKEELAPWRRPLDVLRNIARPSQGAGQTEQVQWGNILAEVRAFDHDPAGLQNLLDDAVHLRDWRLVYACLMGKTDSSGRVMGAAGYDPRGPFIGVPLRTLPLPGVEEVEQYALAAELAGILLDQVQLEVNSWRGNAGHIVWAAADAGVSSRSASNGLVTSLAIESQNVQVVRAYEQAKAQRARLQADLPAVERWKNWRQEMDIKESLPFEEQLAEEAKRLQDIKANPGARL
jgi:hypothetical protein